MENVKFIPPALAAAPVLLIGIQKATGLAPMQAIVIFLLAAFVLVSGPGAWALQGKKA